MKKWCSVMLVLALAAVAYAETQVHFKIGDMQEWEQLLQPFEPGSSMIRPMMPPEWDEYWMMWQQPQEGPPYPHTQFLVPVLYPAPCRPEPGPAGCVPGGAEAGLVMAWGDPILQELPDGDYAAAFVFQYGEDPDLSNSTVKIQVEAPCGMTQISLGLQDVNGNIRSWYWNVAPPGGPIGPGMLPCSPDAAGNPVRVPIQIDVSQPPAMAATPQAAAWMDTGLDPTQVQQIIFDENMAWVAGTVPPPPGQTDPKPWNYWFDLAVTPNGARAYKGNFPKWSQPPVERDEGLIWGWDELSRYDPEQWIGPVLADDWLCRDRRPVTDVHWWGSFKGWQKRELPPVLPHAFLLGIWTDVPATADMPSHPGRLVWRHVCDNWVWNFAGYDLDPRCQMPDTPCEREEACFQFNQLLSEPDWFWQDPLDGQQVYWLSIAAIYDPGVEVIHPWGWKTRPHIFNDDAVRITDWSGPLPWQPFQTTVTGFDEIQFPPGVSWDLAFELTTNVRPRCHALPSDINHDCIVDLRDLAIVAAQWLDKE